MTFHLSFCCFDVEEVFKAKLTSSLAIMQLKNVLKMRTFVVSSANKQMIIGKNIFVADDYDIRRADVISIYLEFHLTTYAALTWLCICMELFTDVVYL